MPETDAAHHASPSEARRGDGGGQSSSSKSPMSSSQRVFSFHASAGMKSFAKRYRTEIAASTSSVLSTFAAFPLDFAKSRMQSYSTSFVATILDAYRAEGLRAFWRGVGPPIISVTVVRTMSFSIYQKAKYAIDRSMVETLGVSPLKQANTPGAYPTPATMTTFALAGAAAGAVITTISCPFELTKLNEQLAGKMARDRAAAAAAKNATKAGTSPTPTPKPDLRSGGSWATARRLVKERGWKGLYVGYRLHLLRDTIGTGIYFMTYESCKQILGNARGRSASSPYAVVVAGGLCGIVSWACIYPVDVAKTLYQKNLLAAETVTRLMTKSDQRAEDKQHKTNIRFFQMGSYRGLGVSVARSCIINMIFFSNFEVMKKWINGLES